MRDSFIELFWNKQGTPKQTEATDETPGESRAPLPAGTATSEAVAKLRSAIGMEQGSAYTSFMAIVDTLEAAIPDAKARWKAAMEVAARTQAISEADILARFTSLRERLKGEVVTSEDSLHKLDGINVRPRREKLATLENEAEAKRKELSALELQANALREAILTGELALREVAANFQAAHDAVLADIDYAEKQFKEMLDVR